MEAHFDDTVAGGDWLAEQGVVDYFVRHAYQELVQMEHWGCPWSRKPNGDVQVRRFGGMKTERTWFAADKTGFHMLHTLFQTSLKYPSIQRFDEYFVLDLLVNKQQQVQGVLALEISTGALQMNASEEALEREHKGQKLQQQWQAKLQKLTDTSKAYNTDLLHCLELEFSLDVAESICLAALERRESRGAHQRLDAGLTERNDAEFLRHSQVVYAPGKPAELHWQAVDTHISAPGERLYGSAGSVQAGAAVEGQREPKQGDADGRN